MILSRTLSRKIAEFRQRRTITDCLGVTLIGMPLIAAVLLSSTGCGGPSYSLANVSGTVLMNGKPLANANVMFSPAEGQSGPSSSGKTDSKGKFELVTIDLDHPGAVPGQHRVTITTAQATGDDERATISKELVPPKYRDGSFKFEVPVAGSEFANIEIVTR